MDLWKWLGGVGRLRVTGADIAQSLSKVMEDGCCIYDISWRDELNCDITVKGRDIGRLRHILESSGDEIKVLSVMGLPRLLCAAAARPVLLAGVAVLLALDMYIPGRILFLRVEGNTVVPENRILEAAAGIGLRFWADRSEIRSEKIKNALLEAVPQLQWAGVNTKGCVATISVRERQLNEQAPEENEVSSIVASRDGVVSSVTATRGNPLCKIGQAVRAGEVLISGYTDCGITIHATRAEGEVYAYTKHTYCSIMPTIFQQKGEIIGQDKKYTLIIGKKRINFSKSSGISAPGCDKMIVQYHLELPGGFRLPVTLEVESWATRSVADTAVSEQLAQQILSEEARNGVLRKMVAGQILQNEEIIAAEKGVYLLEGEYACREMISQVRKEEHYGEYD